MATENAHRGQSGVRDPDKGRRYHPAPMAEPDPGILSGLPDLGGPRRVRETYPVVEALPGRIVEPRASGLVGFVVRAKSGVVVLRDRAGRECPVRLLPGGFVVEGQVVTLIAPRAPERGPDRTASGSLA